MKHSIREHIIDPIRGKIVKVSTINAELGTGIFDKNGREIFEGDKLQVMKPIELRGEHCEYPETVNVEFANGAFTKGAFIAGDDYLDDFVDCYKDSVEIVGHVEDTK